ncbi:MAG: hypothetical protein ACRC3Z_08285 [Phocaeicola sp.]
MKRFLALSFFSFMLFVSGLAQQNDYLVSTPPSEEETNELTEKQFIDNYFKFYNLCSWVPGMKFMVIPERRDIVMPIFKLKESDRDISTADLRHKIMEYLGVEITERNFIHFNFECEGKIYYHEVKNTTVEQYCQKPKAGIPSLAFLKDVDTAKAELMGRTLYLRTNKVYVDDPNSTAGFREVSIPHNEKVVVTAIGVGTRSFPVKLVFSDSQGKSYYHHVAISKTNCGMVDSDFIMENKNKYFPNAFSFSDANAKEAEALMGLYGNKSIFLIKETPLEDQNGRKVKLPKYSQFTIQSITPEKSSPYSILELVTPNKEAYTIRTTFKPISTVAIILQTGNYFADLFNMGDLIAQYPDIKEGDWARIRKGEVQKNMCSDACRLALGDPIRIHKINEYETWYYTDKVLNFTNKKLDTIN